MSAITTGDSTPIAALSEARAIFDLIQRDFGFSLADRLHIAPEVAMFRVGEDVSIWEQKKFGKYDHQVFFDGEFICFVLAVDTPPVAYLKFLRGFRDKYKAGKIHLDPKIYEIEALAKKKEEKEKEKSDVIKNPTSTEEKIVNEAFKRAKVKSKKHDNKKK